MNVLSTFNSKVSIFCAIIFLLLVHNVHADSVTLAWDPNTESDLEGYKIYYGRISRYDPNFTNYSNCIDVGNVMSYTVSGIQTGLTYYFAATAYNTSKYESYYSNEVVVGGGSAGASSGGGGGGCFIDTATCGQDQVNIIKILKYLRKGYPFKYLHPAKFFNFFNTASK